MIKKGPKQSGFTAVELLITLFVAAAFLIASYQLFNLVVKDGGSIRAQSRAANIAYDYLRQYADSSTTIPCTTSTPFNGAVSVDGITNVNINVSITCLPDAISSLSKVTVTVTYDAPQQTLQYSTLVSSSGTSGSGDITNGLVAWWKLNGNANNYIGSPNGVVNGGATSTTGETGVADTAYAFDGSSGFIQTNSTFGLGTTNVTISLWIYNPTATNSGEFVRIGNTGYGVGMGTTQFDNTYAGNKLVMLYEGVRWIPTTTVIGTGWHHIVMEIDGSGIPTGYVDGVSTGAYPGTNASAPTMNYSFMGGNAGNSRYFNGSIDDVRIYNRVLSVSEILSLYSAGAK
jgi:Tfp pilus assembly protein PilE